MSWPVASRKKDFVSPPRAYGPTGPIGQMIVATVSPVAQYINLSLVVNKPPYDAANSLQAAQERDRPGLTGNYVTIFADGADIGVIVGLTAASVSAGAAPVLATIGVLSGSGTYAGATGTCYRIPSGTKERWLMQPTTDLFMGVVASATGVVRLYQSSPDNS